MSTFSGKTFLLTDNFLISVICSYLYSVCLVSLVLKNTYFKERLSVVASKYTLSDMENIS